MSRLIIKNLPTSVTEDSLREKFSEKGPLTDVQLKYKNGVFRRFAFVGYKTEEDAQAALDFFNNTYFGTYKMQVEICRDLGSNEKPRAWSKYAKDSSAYAQLHPEEIPEKKEKDAMKAKDQAKDKKKKKDKKEAIQDVKVKELLDKYKDDPQFQEYMETHLGKNSLWSNDVLGGTGDGPAVTEETVKELQAKVVDSIPDEEVATAKISDFEYLRRKMVKSKTEAKPKSAEEISKDSSTEKDSVPEKPVKKKEFFTVKIVGLPCKAKKKDVKVFMKPLNPASIRVPRNVTGFAYVGFKTEKELKQALVKNRSFIEGKRIRVFPYTDATLNCGDGTSNEKDARFKEQEDSLKNAETIAESGRIFARNLAYTVTEEDLQDLFSKYGEVSEVLVPIDKLTRKAKGFALITFLLPEHAVKAYSDLSGKSFQGRMLHLLPAKTKLSIDELLEQEGLDFKKKKELSLKKAATQPYTWNTLFLGQNAVTDLIAETYNTTKDKVLDDSGKGSVAVRLALGETQIVNETRKFLSDNGVQLDAFNKPTTQRSNKVILVKNLPAKTTASEIREMFEPHGIVGRVILPPSGVTGIVEFMDKMEAKKAFLRLAYTKFKNLPLYLEWAPEGALLENHDNRTLSSEGGQPKLGSPTGEKKEEGNEEELDLEPDTTLYLKNLNFRTTEEKVKEYFSKCGKVATVTIATKPDPKSPGQRLSQGFGFIQFYRKSSADEALKYLQLSDLDGHKIELKRSHRTLKADVNPRKTVNQEKPTGTKILVRNIPFQATREEVLELFKVFGEIKTLRLPKKMVGTGLHRGFAFVDFQSKNDAKNAMESLGQSTHLYGRRLVLEWAAEDEEDVDALRKRTAERFAGDEPQAKTFKKGVFDMKSAAKKSADDGDDE
ncbi:hypothetical protein ONE63_000596 [Megalurothrips usitatus]|uniref:RRM domain-containing protein n=1 Tax=Megalurothrips usitatus TaxID=439358 RepID=A0AAV7Y2R8_9NEOP|nr:hypothetical protein ONE63_000596 [Megalurothrips usitatus]